MIQSPTMAVMEKAFSFMTFVSFMLHFFHLTYCLDTRGKELSIFDIIELALEKTKAILEPTSGYMINSLSNSTSIVPTEALEDFNASYKNYSAS